MASESQDRGRYLRDFAQLAKTGTLPSPSALPSRPSAPPPVPAIKTPPPHLDGFASGDSSGYVDLASLMSNDPEWADRAIGRVPSPPVSHPPTLAPVAMAALSSQTELTAIAEPKRGARWVIGASVVVSIASLGVLGLVASKQAGFAPWKAATATTSLAATTPLTAAVPSSPAVAPDAVAAPLTTAAAQAPALAQTSTATPAQPRTGAVIAAAKPPPNAGVAAQQKPVPVPSTPAPVAAAVSAPPVAAAIAEPPVAAAHVDPTEITPTPGAATTPAPTGDPLLDAIRASIKKPKH